jgi:hypothetical protein
MFIARQLLLKNILATVNTHAAIEEPVSKQRIGKQATIGLLLETVDSPRFVQSGNKEELS